MTSPVQEIGFCSGELSASEREVLALVAAGLSDVQIA
jgi:DNA-binding CsgD family transcriptional regulator